MELSSAIKDTWKVFILGSLISCLMLLLLLNENQHKPTISSASISVLVNSASNMNVLAPDAQPSISPTLSSSAIPPLSPVIIAHPPLGNNAYFTSNFQHEKPNSSEIIIIQPQEKLNSSTQQEGKTNSTEIIVQQDDNPSFVQVSNQQKRFVKKCNIFDGKWVYNPEATASYCPLKCPFIEEKMSCQSNGRPDFEYEKWVWEANDCDIPMLNGTDLVERFKNKRVVLVGDSLNRNMWESLACTLYSSIPYPSTKAEVRFESAHIRTFLRAKDEYNFTVEFYWSPYLIEHNVNHESGRKVLVLDKLSSNSESWIGADILIFNSGMWWSQTGNKKGWDMYEYDGKLTKDVRLHQAYARAMTTWAKWVKQKVDPKKTKVFFRSISTEHKAPQYNQWCYNRSQPLWEPYRSLYPKTLMRVIENVIKALRRPKVTYLNITKLSQYRIDAHPSVFRNKDWKTISRQFKHNLSAYADCGHWCLPGLPDTWNRLLYASLVFDSISDKF